MTRELRRAGGNPFYVRELVEALVREGAERFVLVEIAPGRTGARSLRACEFVADQGVEAVNVAGGTLAWIRSGRDYVTGAA